MSDDYLVKSGARDLLTLVVAELLAVRPRLPVSYLAAHFQAPTNKIAASAQALRASHPSRANCFQDSLMKVFQQLGTSAEGSSSSLKSLPGSVGPSVAATPTSLVLRNTKPNDQAASLAAQHNAKVRSGTTLGQREFMKLLESLSDEFPKALQLRTLSALQQHSQQPPQGSLESASVVSFAQFQRGVEVCLLLEELLDVVEDLFRAIDKSETGEVRASALLLALEIAASRDSSNNSSSTNEVLLSALRAFVLPSPLGNEASVAAAGDGISTATGELFDRTLRLGDMSDAIFHVVFQV